MASRSISRPVVVAALFLSAIGAAKTPSSSGSAGQQTPTPVVTPIPSSAAPVARATPGLVPGAGIDDLPTPVFVPNPRSTPPAARPIPAATPAAVPGPTPSPMTASTPSPTPTPGSVPTAIARPPIETVILPQRGATPLWAWVLGGVALLLIMLGWLGLRHQSDDVNDEVFDDQMFAQDVPPDVPAEPLPVAVDDRARLSLALRPTRAGLNLISATAECEVTLFNIGGESAQDVHATLRLMSARDGQESELTAFYADTGGRPATPTFTLAPGEERRFRAVAALPHDAIHSIDAGGRPMFVPLLALSVRYRDGEGPRRIGQALMLGLDHGGSGKLAPLWLDGPARSYDNVVARPHGGTIEG